MWVREEERNFPTVSASQTTLSPGKENEMLGPLEDTEGNSANETDVRMIFIKGRV